MGNGVSVAGEGDFSIRLQAYINPAEDFGNTVSLKSGAYREAQQQLSERVGKLIKSNKYPSGRVEVRKNIVVLANIPFTGGEEALFGIRPIGGSYEIVDYADLPDYMDN